MSRYRALARKYWLAEVVVGAVLLVLAAVTMWSCNTRSPGLDRADSSTITAGKALGSISILPLYAPGNPYKAQYREWDVWIMQHMRQRPAPREPGAEKLDNYVLLGVSITGEGYLVPMLEMVRLREEARRRGDEFLVDGFETAYAEGVMEPELRAASRAARYDVRAKYFPRVPDWLPQNPPDYAMLYPNGDVITRQLLEVDASAKDGHDSGCCGGGPKSYVRYDAQGQAVASCKTIPFYLYYDEVVEGRIQGVQKSRADGITYFTATNEPNSEILSVWDWDGTRLPGTALPPYRGGRYFTSLNRDAIIGIYEAQQRTQQAVVPAL